MEKLIYFDKELNIIVEHELYADSEFGFDVVLVYDKKFEACVFEGKQIIEHVHNLTEVHHLFKGFALHNEKRCAFESDIHRTGFWRNVDELESVTITKSTKKYEFFCDTLYKPI